ncbi:ABC transporter permease [Macrococcus equi]|uniref:ABC transporter permease n=1 Tax=Macrococcus equi TaxID=3395462 RepID=UPI0039BDD845
MQFKQYGLLLVITLLVILFSVTAPNFLTSDNLLSVISGMAIVTIVAIGITFSLSIDGFDLSVGSTVTLSNAIIISLFVWHGLDIGLSIAITLAVALFVAFINIILIIKFKVPDLYATLATMFIVEGGALTYSEGGSISQGMTRQNGVATTGKIPDAFKILAEPIPLIIIMISIVLITYILLHRTNPGRIMYMIGDNKHAVQFGGIKTTKYIIISYFASAFFACISGILLASQVSSAQVNSGSGYLMTAVAAAFIGATVSKSGKPNIIGTFLGALLIAVLENGLVMLSVPYYGLNIIKGLVLAGALIINYTQFKQRRLKRVTYRSEIPVTQQSV